MSGNGYKSNNKQKEQPWASLFGLSEKIVRAPVSFITAIGDAAKSAMSKVPAPQQSAKSMVSDMVASSKKEIRPPSTSIDDRMKYSTKISAGSSTDAYRSKDPMEYYLADQYSPYHPYAAHDSKSQSSLYKKKI